ncbi:hypothetical protein NMS57_001197 [Vibrio alginolyticus]|nr:hypothetical protein [Vibrio alginolyticus]
MDKVIVIQGNKTVDLYADYKGVLHESEIITLYESMKEFEPRLNTGLRQTLNRLIAHADEQTPPLSYDNVKSYLLSINEQLEAGDSGKRTYRSNLKKFFTSINFGDDIAHLVSQRKGRKLKPVAERKAKVERKPSPPQDPSARKTRSSMQSQRVPLRYTERRTHSHKAKHKSQGLSSEQAKLPSESNVSRLNPLIFKLKNSNNMLITIDLQKVFDSTFISYSELQKYAKHIHDSPLRDASKVTYLGALRQLVQYNNKVTRCPEFYSKESFQPFIASLYDEMTKGAKIKSASIERKQACLSAGFELIGLPKMLRADKFKLKTSGNDLRTDNYDYTSWKATIRALIPEHQRLYKLVRNNAISYEQDFNNFISCSCLLLTVYTGMTFSELNSGVIAGRHRLSVHRGYNYSKVSKETAQKEMTQTAHALEKHARGIKISIAVQEGKNIYNPKIINEKEKQESGVAEVKNGGTCKGLETPESKEFQKSLDKNLLLSDEDKKLMGCGFIIKCFGCANFAVVDEVNDIWKLLSFESILNDSINYHVSFAHFIEKQGELKAKLQIIKDKLSPKKLATAIKKLDKQGLHPLWDGMYAVLDKMDI